MQMHEQMDTLAPGLQASWQVPCPSGVGACVLSATVTGLVYNSVHAWMSHLDLFPQFLSRRSEGVLGDDYRKRLALSEQSGGNLCARQAETSALQLAIIPYRS